ncbi:MAG: hypothetical protein A2V78_12520 [Betaproteobacteria bacterium RBG_16_64_18]|nr:MAG: hypothetical protein A2V78_12520 [Betaproteobacteria bacterium RBG_16_64_18]OGA09841.1 MAG: hypothetical protein A3H33_03250 [Betaproteobacteria bacterium RIFCSPLOWO2_02_FULL_65_20]
MRTLSRWPRELPDDQLRDCAVGEQNLLVNEQRWAAACRAAPHRASGFTRHMAHYATEGPAPLPCRAPAPGRRISGLGSIRDDCDAPTLADAKNPPPARAAAALEFSANDVTTVERRDIRQLISLTGTLSPRNQTTVKTKVSAEVREGESVRRGQVISRLDATEPQARLGEKNADLAKAAASAIRRPPRRCETHNRLITSSPRPLVTAKAGSGSRHW